MRGGGRERERMREGGGDRERDRERIMKEGGENKRGENKRGRVVREG